MNIIEEELVLFNAYGLDVTDILEDDEIIDLLCLMKNSGNSSAYEGFRNLLVIHLDTNHR